MKVNGLGRSVWRWTTWCCLAAAPLSAVDSASPSTLRAVRFWTNPGVTRVAIEASGELPFHAERLHNPERIFFDLQGAKGMPGRRKAQIIAVSDNILKQIRIAETQPNTVRIVFDLAADADFTTSQLSNPDRLMIEFRHGPAPALLAADPKPEPAILSSNPQRSFMPPPVRPPDVAPLPQTPLPVLKQAPELRSGRRLQELPQPRTSWQGAAPPPANPTVAQAVAKVLQERAAVRDTMPPATMPSTTTSAKEIEQATAFSAKPTSTGDRSLTRVLGLKLGRVVLDAGHGGHDTGTNGPTGLTEKDLVLDVTKRLGALIQDRLGSEVIYTRDDDTFIPLELRTQIANDRKADLFLSIHANSSPMRTATGVETYYLNFTTSQDALDVAARENAGSQKNIYELKDLLQKIALKEKADESREFAARIQSAMASLAVKTNPHARDRGVKKAPFLVLIGASMPSVLAEIGFVSNPKDETLMKRPETRQKIAEALFKGLSQYAGTLSHFQVAQDAPHLPARKSGE